MGRVNKSSSPQGLINAAIYRSKHLHVQLLFILLPSTCLNLYKQKLFYFSKKIKFTHSSFVA
jgi:hypothetical protein